MNANRAVPVVDFSSLGNSESGHEMSRIIDQACRETGFFYLVNHGISTRNIERLWAQVAWFFKLSGADKMAVARSEINSRGYYNRELTKNVRDMKEVFDFGHKPVAQRPDTHPDNRTQDGWNQWPNTGQHDDFKSVLTQYYERCGRIALRLLQVLTANLGAAKDSLIKDFDPVHSSFLRLNYYPVEDPLAGGKAQANSAADSGHMGVHHHTDAGALTLLLQDDVGGLEIRNQGRWAAVKPRPETLVVNIGDIVQVWSNDRYRAPLHRVVASTQRNRYSVPYFFNPAYAANYEPLEEAIGEGQRAHYSKINWGHFRHQRQHGDYGDYGNEIQIRDYRLE